MMTSSVSNLKKRIVITGLGVVAPNGIGKDAFWEAVVQGRSAVSWVESFDASDLYCQIAGEVKDFDPADYMDRAAARKAGRFSHFAVAAARLAIEDAAVNLSGLDPFRMGACFGTSLAGNGNVADEMYEEFMTRGPRRVDLSAGVELSPHAATSHVFIEFGMRGPNATTSTGCVSSLDALIQARTLLQTGEADLIVAGGTEACISRVGMTLLCKIGVLSHRNEEPEKASRPYDATRDGLVLSEGAGAVVLETAEHALDRGAHIYAEVRGYGCATEARH
jgi:3-oxoacyl-[acyl-carrier-protein] synthase II